jgi:hypothetical protein
MFKISFLYNRTGVRFRVSGVRIAKLMTRRLSDFAFCHLFADPPAAENLTPETKNIVTFKELHQCKIF